jgi:hypothetical protein
LLLGWRQMPNALAIVAAALAAACACLLSIAAQFEFKPGGALELAGTAFWAAQVLILGKFASGCNAVSFSAGQLLGQAL